MAFHLAPVGLPPPKKRADPRQHAAIEERIATAVREIFEMACKQRFVYNAAHPYTQELLKSLDALFSHGLHTDDRCYWRFVREFIPAAEQKELEIEWNARGARALSKAWLKDSLNRVTLQFQLLGFASCDRRQLAARYCKTACLRNQCLVHRVCGCLENLALVEFNIEKPYVDRIEDVPIALPVRSPSVQRVESPMGTTTTIVRRRKPPANAEALVIQNPLLSDESEVVLASSLAEMTRHLPEVDVPSTAHEPFVSTRKDQEYMLNQMAPSHRSRLRGFLEPLSANVTSPELSADESSDGAKLPEIVTSSPKETAHHVPLPSFTSAADEKVISPKPEDERMPSVEADQPEKVPERSLDATMDLGDVFQPSEASIQSGPTSVTEQLEAIGDDGVAPLPAEGVFADCEVPVVSGEQVNLAVNVFPADSETFQRMFSVFMGHSVGAPKLRLLCVTNYSIYLLSQTKSAVACEDDDDVAAEAAYALDDDADPHEAGYDSINYITNATIPLSDLDCVTVGKDAQVICFHSKRRRFLSDDMDHENRTLLVETGSIDGGKAIAHCIFKTIKNASHLTHRPTIFTQGTQMHITLNRFTRAELGTPDFEVIHHVLVYWQQIAPQRASPELKSEEGYLYVRNFYPKSWVKPYDEWEQSYFVLKGHMLYHFSDSTCKFAQRSMNIRDTFEQVYEVDLKNDERYVFEVALTDDANTALQFSCPSEEIKKNWISAITLILSTAAVDHDAAVAPCLLTLTTDHVILAQEGANCIVDGFMRSLASFSVREIRAVYSIRTETQHAVVLLRDSGHREWIFLRTHAEQGRLLRTLRLKWQLEVIESDEQKGPTPYHELFTQCLQLADHWNTVDFHEPTL
ncbi:PH domain-containing protein [Aphelenchoides avenae]|nr:PH domain-containing protein [Aphelenchus avenae]